MLVYTLVARGPPAPILPLAEYRVIDDGDFLFKAEHFIRIISVADDKMMSYKSGNLSYYYMLHKGFTYCVVTDQKNEGDPSFYLDSVKMEFRKKYGDDGENAASAPAYALNDEFGPTLRDYMMNYDKYYGPEMVKAREMVERQMMVRRRNEMQRIERRWNEVNEMNERFIERLRNSRDVERQRNEMQMKEMKEMKENTWSKRCRRLISKTICGGFMKK